MEETTQNLRLRVVFEDRHLLSKTQRSQGLKQSIILVKSDIKTISQLSSHLITTFNLHHSCPNGIQLHMDTFVLPNFESTQLLKDNDIISVKKNAVKSLEYVDVVEKEPLLLTLEGFDKKEKSGDELEESDSPNTAEQTTCCAKKSSKKRKLDKQGDTSRKKKLKYTCPENSSDIPAKGVENHVHEKDQSGCQKEAVSRKSLRKDSSKTSVTLKKAGKAEVGKITKDDVKDMATKKSCDSIQESGEEDIEDDAPEGTKKGPSRSARRKKAKRKWLRELLNSKKEELDQGVHAKVISDKSEDRQESEGKDDIEAEIVPVVVRPGHIRFEPLDKDLTSQPIHSPKKNFQWNGITSKKKGQKWGMEKGSVSWSNGREDFRGDSIEPETNQWNNKRHKQKKTIQENTSTQKNMDIDVIAEKQNVEEKEVPHGPVDFEKLNPLTSSPKEGEVIAYRLIELSSTWTPEVSDFRVGKVAWFDPTTKVIMLVQVPGYPIVSNEKKDESSFSEEYQDEAIPTQEPDSSLYFEDGSLEIDFGSLLEVRTFNNDKSSPETVAPLSNKEAAMSNVTRTNVAVTGICALNNDKSTPETVAPVSNKEVAVMNKSLSNETRTSVAVTENGGSKNPWEEFSQVLIEKKAQLSNESDDGWTQKGDDGWTQKEKQSTTMNGSNSGWTQKEKQTTTRNGSNGGWAQKEKQTTTRNGSDSGWTQKEKQTTTRNGSDSGWTQKEKQTTTRNGSDSGWTQKEKQTTTTNGSNDGWTPKEKQTTTTGRRDWSYRSMRSGGLGAIMSRLRSGNDL